MRHTNGARGACGMRTSLGAGKSCGWYLRVGRLGPAGCAGVSVKASSAWPRARPGSSAWCGRFGFRFVRLRFRSGFWLSLRLDLLSFIFRQVRRWIGLRYSGTRSFQSLSGRILPVWEYPPTIIKLEISKLIGNFEFFTYLLRTR